MADRIGFELVNATSDSLTTSQAIDTCRYGWEHVPKGYARQVGVEAQIRPNPLKDPMDPLFENEHE